ncbi:MAG: DUF4214 domain-containing protein, partial [Acidimicrobiales bacterium]
MTRRLLFPLVVLVLGSIVSVPASAAAPTIQNAESIQGIINSVDYAPDTHGDVLRLYRAFFDREPDLVGAKYWLDVNESGHSLDDIAGYFTGSDEFANNYEGTTDEEYLRRVYANVLGRAYDEAGFAYWLDLLQGTNDAGFNQARASISRGAVVRWVSAGAEFEARYPYRPDPAAPGGPQNPGNPFGTAAVPTGAGEEPTSSPDHVIGNGTPASCTSAAVVAAVAQGGTITFDCGSDPVTIEMYATAKVVNDQDPDIVIDGGGLVTLSGRGERRILYMNTCDPAQVWTTPHCQNQDHPRLTVQNIRFTDGNSVGQGYMGGGAVFVRGGRFKAVNTIFTSNRCESVGPDVAGAGLRVLSQFNGLPVYITNSTFGGSAAEANVCSNGGGISTIGASFTILNSMFSHNHAIGNGANPAQPGTPGGGNGGAIYNDG